MSSNRETCRVVSDYTAAYPNPLFLSAGDELTTSKKESEWDGWLWCTDQTGKSGWVPEAYVERESNMCLALCDYDATELSVRVGEKLIMSKEASGWIWCTNKEGQSGWVPAEHLSYELGNG